MDKYNKDRFSWSNNEIKIILNKYRVTSPLTLAEELKRRPFTIYKKAQDLGVERRRAWKDWEIKILFDSAEEYPIYKIVGLINSKREELGLRKRTQSTIREKMICLGLLLRVKESSRFITVEELSKAFRCPESTLYAWIDKYKDWLEIDRKSNKGTIYIPRTKLKKLFIEAPQSLIKFEGKIDIIFLIRILN